MTPVVLESPRPSRPAPVPAEHRTRRMRRMRHHRRRRRRVLALAAVVAAGLYLLPAGVGSVRDGLLPSRGGSPVPAGPGSLLLAWPTADDGGAVMVMLGARQGSALLVPGRVQVEVPSFGSRTLAGALRAGGAGTVALTLENALGYDIGDVLALDDADELAAVLEPAAPLGVDLYRPVRLGDETFPATPMRLSAGEAARLVTVRAEEATDLDHLVVVHAVLEAWLAELDGDVLGLTHERLVRALGLPDVRAAAVVALLDELSRRDVTFDTLDVVSMGLPGEERYAIETAKAAAETASLFPGLAFAGEGARIRVEILNGTGRAGLATEVAQRIVPLGAHVVLTGNAAEFGVEETLLVLADARFEARARRLVEALGTGVVRMARDPVGAADISIVVGSDFDIGPSKE